MADIVNMAKDELKVRGKADAAALAARAVSGEADGTELTASQDQDRKSTRLNSSHTQKSRMPSSA